MATDTEPVHVDVQVDTRDAPRDPRLAPMETDPKSTHKGMHGDTRNAPPSATVPMEMDEHSTKGQARPQSQSNSHRSRPRTPDSTHTSGMWFCPMPRCACRGGLTDGMGLHTVVRVPPPLAGRPRPPGVLGLPGDIPTRGAVPGTTLLHGSSGGTGRGQQCPPSARTLATGMASPGGHGPHTLSGEARLHAALGPHRGLFQLRPGTDLPAAGPGTGAHMGDPGSPPPIPPHRPCGTHTGR